MGTGDRAAAAQSLELLDNWRTAGAAMAIVMAGLLPFAAAWHTGYLATIVASTERSLHRLRTDYLDLLQLHNPPLEVLLAPDVREALARLVASGKIRAWGASAKAPPLSGRRESGVVHSKTRPVFGPLNVRSIRAAPPSE